MLNANMIHVCLNKLSDFRYWLCTTIFDFRSVGIPTVNMNINHVMVSLKHSRTFISAVLSAAP